VRTMQITALLAEPAALGKPSRADYRQDTYDHVPGSVLRGALAATWLRTPGAPGPEHTTFRTVFEGEGLFGPLHSTASLPVPLSVWTHKGEPGPCCTKLWWDAAVEALPDPLSCPTCRGRLAQSKGDPVGTPRLHSRTRVALDNNGVAAEGRLFRRDALATELPLTGWVSGAAVDALAPAGQVVTELRFGGERSVRGRATITARPAAPPPIELSGCDVVLRLAAPAVFVDRFGHAADKPSRLELKAALGQAVKKITAWTRWTEVGGWHMAAGVPKSRDRAVAAGSTYLVRCAAAPDPARLAELAARGVGLRRREGCGALHPCPAEPLATSPFYRALEPLRGWPDWPQLRAALGEKAAGRAARIIQPTSGPERDAATALVGVQDRARLRRLLDLLEETT